MGPEPEQSDFCEFMATLVYMVRSKIARAAE